MKPKLWIPFIAIQIVGMILPQFANFHSNIAPAVLGLVLLLPGSAAMFFSPRLPTWTEVMIIVGVNAFVWWDVAKLWDTELK
jgi:hypothetical protein